MRKQFLIVGASGKIGSSILSTLLARGDQCLATSRQVSFRNPDENQDFPEETVNNISLDLDDPVSISEGVRGIRARFPKLDGIVFASGVATGSIIQMTKGSTFSKTNQVNAIGPIQVLSGLIPHLNPGASVVFLSSASGAFVQRGNSGYGASKLLLERLVHGIALEVPKDSLRVHLVVPGPVESVMFREMDTRSAKEMMGRSSVTKPIAADDLARLIGFLLSEDSRAITSGKLVLDAGFW